MKAFAIAGSNVIAYDNLAEAKRALAAAGEAEPRLLVTSERELAASPLSLGQLTEIWNGFAGVAPFDDLKPVRKFTDRRTAVSRIWRAIQRLAPAPTEAAGAAQTAQDAPEATAASTEASPKKQAARVRKGAKAAAPARQGSKKAQVIQLLRRPEGATLWELMQATGWQAHSVRGFLSGSLGKKGGYRVARRKRDDGSSAYFLSE